MHTWRINLPCPRVTLGLIWYSYLYVEICMLKIVFSKYILVINYTSHVFVLGSHWTTNGTEYKQLMLCWGHNRYLSGVLWLTPTPTKKWEKLHCIFIFFRVSWLHSKEMASFQKICCGGAYPSYTNGFRKSCCTR